jgi:hypothetical protein
MFRLSVSHLAADPTVERTESGDGRTGDPLGGAASFTPSLPAVRSARGG